METARLIQLIYEAELLLHQNADSDACWRESMLDLRQQMLAAYEARGVPTIVDAVLSLRTAADLIDAITPPTPTTVEIDERLARYGVTAKDLPQPAPDGGIAKDLRQMADVLEIEGWTGKRADDGLWSLWRRALKRFPDSFVPLAAQVARRGLPTPKRRQYTRRELTNAEWRARLRQEARWRALLNNAKPQDPGWTPEKAAERLRADLKADREKEPSAGCVWTEVAERMRAERRAAREKKGRRKMRQGGT